MAKKKKKAEKLKGKGMQAEILFSNFLYYKAVNDSLYFKWCQKHQQSSKNKIMWISVRT